MKAHRSLEARLTAWFLALSLTTLAVAAGIGYHSARDSLADSLFQHLEAISALKQSELDLWVEERLRFLRLLAEQPSVKEAAAAAEPDTAYLRTALAVTRQTGGDFAEIFVLGARGGAVLASTDSTRIGDYHTPDPFFLQGRFGAVQQSVYPSPVTGAPTMTVAVPIRASEAEAVAVLAGHLDLARVERIVDAALADDEHATSRAYLVTASNEILSATRFGLADYRRGVSSDGIEAALEQRAGVGLYEGYDGTPVIGAYRWLPEHSVALLVEIAQEEAFAPARELLRRIVFFGLGATLVLTFSVQWISDRVVRPITAVADAAARVADGDFSVSTPAEGSDEVGDLARSFNSMTGRLRTLYTNLEEQIEVSKAALGELESSRGLLAAILDNATALICVTDLNGHILIANDPLRAIIAGDDQPVHGMKLEQVLPWEVAAEWAETLVPLHEHGEAVERQVEWVIEGQRRTYLFTWFPLEDTGNGERGIGIVASDLTERARVEEERRRIEAQFRHAQKLESLGVLAGGIAHDFNNILAAIMGHADLATLSLDDDVEETREHLDEVSAGARRAAELTNQMLAYAGKASFRMQTLDLNQTVIELTNLMQVSLPKKVELVSELSPEPLPLRGDPAQISQVVMNLVTNAAQAIGDQPGIVRVTSAPSVRANGGSRAVLRISDTGCGMDGETLERIFDPFFTTKDTGRGLGLAAVMGIMRSLDGSLDVESEPGKGTTFRLTFPLADTNDPPHVPKLDATRDAVDGVEATILLVDDEKAIRRFARRALERVGFNVLEAEDGLAALDVYRREAKRVDAVVLDMSMPGMGGREVFDVLREADGTLPVLFTSGYDPSDAAGALLDAPGVRFLQKPYSPGTLGQELEELLQAAPSVR